MQINNPFDRALDVRQIPAFTRIAATEIAGDLELAWDLVRAVFEKQATPDHAIEVCKMFIQRSDQVRAAAERSAEEANRA